MAQKPRGICRNCGKNRAFYDLEYKLCSECAELLKNGEIQPPTPKKPGRKPDLFSSNNDQGNGNETENNDQTIDNETELQCEGCGSRVYYGQRKCSSCGIYLDWRGTKLETDDSVLICPECGCLVGYADHPPAACPHCNYAGGE